MEGKHIMHEKGKKEFDDFAKKTWKYLIEEAQQDIGDTGLLLFGRLDISFTEVQPHQFQFYVNEVERSATCNLFFDNFSFEVPILISKLITELPRYCRARC